MKKDILVKTALSLVATCTLASAVTDFNAGVCDPDFVASKIGDPNWVIVDGRGEATYKKGHIPSSVTFKKAIVTILKHPVDGRVVPADDYEKKVGSLGIDNNKGVIVYGTTGDYHISTEMSGIYYGMKNYCYLDGGFETWKKNGKPVETKVNTPKPAKFKAKIAHPEMYISTEEVMGIIKHGSVKTSIIDVRSKGEYEAEENTLVRGGRIPGAINIVHDSPIDKDAMLLPIEKLRKIYKDIPKDNQVIIYCHRGCRTSFTYSALKLLGYKNVKIYEEGMIVWGARADTPMENEHDINLRAYDKKIKHLLQDVAELKKMIKEGNIQTGAAPQAKEAPAEFEGC